MAAVSEWQFNSIACFDLETTGLPQYDNNVKITELAVSAVVRAHIKPCGVAEKVSAVCLPRVVQKLSFSMYPNKIISPAASAISGLYNDILEPIKPWSKETAEMLITFFNLLPPPVCLVAHNGIKFDFPIFKQHLNKFQLSLPNDVLYVDSLPAFRKLLPELLKEKPTIVEEMKEEMSFDNDELIRTLDDFEKQQQSNYKNPSKIPCNVEHDEVTPVPRSKLSVNNTLYTSKKIIQNDKYLPNNSQVRRCLFPTKPRVSYKLSEVHKQLFGVHPDQSHNAEEDALTLLKCILKTSPQFLLWANENCQLFNCIE